MRYIFLFIFGVLFSCTQPHTQGEDKTALYDYHVESRLSELNITLTPPAAPVANYVNATRAGNLVFLAGKGPRKADGTYISGKVPSEVSTEEAYKAARLTAVQLLNALKAEIGDLNKVEQVVEVFGM